jgi:periplasmic protein TonB
MSFVTKRVYTLTRSYKRALQISFIIVLLSVIAAFNLAPQNNKPQQIRQTGDDVLVIPDVSPTQQLIQPPPPPRPPLLIEAFLDDEIEDIILPPADIDIGADTPPLPVPPKPPLVEDEVVPFEKLEAYPEPVGGMQSIISKIHYTELAIRAEIEGTVVIEAILSKTGEVIEAHLIKKIGGGLDEIALLAVKNTKFKPGMQRDKPVKVKLSVPVRFRLQ